MWKQIWSAVKGLCGSKKAMMAILSAAAWLVGKAGFELDTEQLAPAIAPLWLYIFAQGAADIGKSRAMVEAGNSVAEASAAPPAPPAPPA